jgi:hypothetical protein
MQTDRNNDSRNENREAQDRNQNTGNLGNERQNMSSRGNGLNDPGMENDNYAGAERDINDSTEAQSRTFNEDEATFENEQRMTGNQGTRNNDWDENDQMQRSPGRSYDEEDLDASSRGRYNDEEQNRYGSEENRRNREELE